MTRKTKEIDLGIPGAAHPAQEPETAPSAPAAGPVIGELLPSPDVSHEIAGLARDLGYEGALTVGALEDGIRIYQRRTVEDCIELGKCLLLLKEMTPHGEFTPRIELLGIGERTARRFMSAARKISQNGHLSDLSARMKSITSVLELVTQDDDVLERLSDMDDIDLLTPSELRARLREYESADQDGPPMDSPLLARLTEEKADLERKIENHEKHYDELEMRYQEKDAQLRLAMGSQLPGAYSPRTVALRHESAAMEYGSRLHVDELEAMYESALVAEAPNQQERELRIHAVALAASGIFARAEALYSRLKIELGDFMPVQPDGMLQLTEDERQKLKGSVVMLRDAFLEKKSKRERERYVEQLSRGPGRPLGAKNKDKAKG